MSLLFGLSRQNSAIVSTMSSDSGFYSLIKNALRVTTQQGALNSDYLAIGLSLLLLKHNAQHSAKRLCGTPQ